jgi:hypothetical protein
MQEFLILNYILICCFSLYTVADSKSFIQTFLNFVKEWPSLLLVLIIFRLAVHDLPSFFLGLFVICYFIILKSNKITTTENLFMSLLFITFIGWSNKIEDYSLFFSLVLLFSIFKILTLNLENRAILITDYYPGLIVEQPMINVNILHSKTLETLGSIAKNIVCEMISKEPATQAKIAEVIQIGFEKSLKHRGKVGTATITSGIGTAYHVANQRFKANQHFKIDDKYNKALRTSEHYNTYGEEQNPVFKKKFREAFENAASEQENFVAVNLHDALYYQAVEKITNPDFLALLEISDLTKHIG